MKKSVKQLPPVCRYNKEHRGGSTLCYLYCFTEDEPAFWLDWKKNKFEAVQVDPQTGIAYTRDLNHPIEEDEFVR